MREPSVTSWSEDSQQLHFPSEDLVLLRKRSERGSSCVRTGVDSVSVLLTNNNNSFNRQNNKRERDYQKEQLSVRGTSSKLFSKRFLTFLPRQISEESRIRTSSHFNCGFPPTDKCAREEKKNYWWDNTGSINLFNSTLFCETFKGFPEVRRREISSTLNKSDRRRDSQFYRIPKLLEQAFQPEVCKSYTYKCSVRTSQNVLSPQTVTISLQEKTCRQESSKKYPGQ